MFSSPGFFNEVNLDTSVIRTYPFGDSRHTKEDSGAVRLSHRRFA